MRRPSPLPPGSAEIFTAGEARTAGISRQRTRAPDVAHPFHGVHAAFPVLSTSDRALAFSHVMHPHQFFSHLTAAELLGLRMPEGFRAGPLDVTSLAPLRAPRGRGIRGHQASTAQLVTIGELRISSPLATWLDLGAVLPLDDFIVMADGLLSRQSPRCTVQQMSTALHSHEGRRGHARLTQAWRMVRPNTDSARETMLRLIVVRAGFPEPAVNPEIRNRYGAVIAHGDLVYPDHKVILEYDGGGHRTDERQYNIDIDRLDELMEEGWRIIRVNKSLMARRATLLGKINTALRERGWSPPTN